MVLYVFLINAVLAVVAALLVTPTYLAKFDMGDSIGQKAFFAAIIGGFNQTRGALLGGVLIGDAGERRRLLRVARVQGRRRAGPVPRSSSCSGPRACSARPRSARYERATCKTSNRSGRCARRACACVPRFLKRYDVYLLTLCCVYLMATFGLNLTVGYAGQMSLGQAAFFGIGAYIAAIALKARRAVSASCCRSRRVACFAVGLALGFPALRVQHHYLAFATLGFNVLVFLVMRNEEKITGGTFGISGIPRPSLFGLSLDGHLAVLLFHACVSLVVLALLLWWLLRSPWGRAFAALRDNPIRAESLGVNITAYTLLAFAIGAACAGIGGVYFASLVEFIEPGPFHFSTSLMMLLAVIVGGSGRFFGPVIGTVDHHPAAGAPARQQHGSAQVHAELVSRCSSASPSSR